MTFNPVHDWRPDEVRRLLASLVVCTDPAYRTFDVGHVHSAYRLGPGAYQVAVAWHDGSAVVRNWEGKPVRVNAEAYPRSLYQQTLQPFAGSLYEALGVDAGTHPCHATDLSCPVVTRSRRR